MSGRTGSAIAAKVMAKITAPAGVNSNLAALTLGSEGMAGPLDPAQVRLQNVSVELAERGDTVRYPAVHVYCEKIVNNLTEKFRRFSGTVQMTVELRHSQDGLTGLQDALELYVDAVTQVLDASRGDWGDGAYYCGGYQAAFGAVKHGGRNFIQVAKVTFEIGVSIS